MVNIHVFLRQWSDFLPQVMVHLTQVIALSLFILIRTFLPHIWLASMHGCND